MLFRYQAGRRFIVLFILPVLILCLLPPQQAYLSAVSVAQPAVSPPAFQGNEETRELLEKTLSAAEIEREIARISLEQEELEQKSILLQEQAAVKENEIEKRREQAGAVVRSYYMGERDGLLATLLSAKSISRVLALYDYYEIIIGRDRDVLSQYEHQYKDLKSTLAAAERSVRELAELKQTLEQQKQRVLALNEEIEGGINASSDPEAMGALLEEFTKYWESVGLHEVETYFRALSKAMNKLPQFVESQKGILKRKGMTYQLTLGEEELNRFLVSQNPLFTDFGFQFRDGKVTASGMSGGLTLTLTGRYAIQEEPENALMFHVEQVVFNGLQLPESTCRSLEENFDLGFYPRKIVSFLRATEVNSSDGVLSVKLSLSF
ncbi:coiled-coil domain-containing protein [Paenibacillus tengchongensis]|uniref:coiled-coil domain-containing protein n=1 Tax=Paenibacillus tengchongensis TaxID=2608684 RepID=UPI001FEB6344|nr:hypothetical protein [Paenibacillus tengchongensis]